MALPMAHAATGEAAAVIAMLERSAQRGGNHPGSSAHFDGGSGLVMPHPCAGCVTGESLRRFSWNARSIIQNCLPTIYMNHDLIAFTRRPRLHAVM